MDLLLFLDLLAYYFRKHSLPPTLPISWLSPPYSLLLAAVIFLFLSSAITLLGHHPTHKLQNHRDLQLSFMSTSQEEERTFRPIVPIDPFPFFYTWRWNVTENGDQNEFLSVDDGDNIFESEHNSYRQHTFNFSTGVRETRIKTNHVIRLNRDVEKLISRACYELSSRITRARARKIHSIKLQPNLVIRGKVSKTITQVPYRKSTISLRIIFASLLFA